MRARMNLDNVRSSLAYVGHGSKITAVYNVRATLAERASELCQPGVPFVGSHCRGFIHECIGPGHCAAGALWLPEYICAACCDLET